MSKFRSNKQHRDSFHNGRKYLQKRGVVLLVPFFILLLCFLTPLTAFADTDSAPDFETDRFDVTINVKDDNSAYITENVDVTVLSPIHGIYRYIPLANTVQYFDAKGKQIDKVRKNIKVEDITVEKDLFESYKDNGNMVIKIGEADKLIRDTHQYSYSYRVRLYDDGIKDYDVFYYNVIPTNWETSIKASTITVNMPKAFAEKDVNVLAGKPSKSILSGEDEVYGKQYYDWSIEGNTITINTLQELPQGSYITVGIMLPEGYFTGELSDRKTYWLLYALGLFSGLLMLYMWFTKGRDPKSVQTVEFYPPEGLTPAEIGYIIDGMVDRKDVLSLLIYFANKGYLAIEETAKDAYTVHKLRDLPPGAKDFEALFFNGLFAYGDSADLTDLPEDFYTTYQATKEAISNSYQTRAKRLFSRTASKWRILSFVIVMVVSLLGGLIISRLYGNIGLMGAAAGVIICLMCSYVMALLVEDRKYVSKKGGRFTKTIISLILLLVAMAGTYFYMYLSVGTRLAAILFIFMEASGYFAVRFMRARTKYGAEILGKVLGFKEFINVAELGKLEMLVEQDPTYFYDILPYAYVMGLSKKWAKKFENIRTEAPGWYSASYGGGSVFNSWMFYRSFDHCMDMAGSYIATPPSVGGFEGGGSFGGGGFSGGGGFGGGGGGSW
ncbi:MAG: DUF2207 domain-containing protein [Firmicutes bacterium]|nr:DUF2207 domain-containing protein [Bacillota bacterium]